MATAEDYAAWIVKNEAKRGTPEFDTVAAAYKAAKSAALRYEAKIAAQRAADEQEFSPLNGMSTFDKFAAGAGQAITNAGRGVGQLVGMVSDSDIAEAKKRDAPLESTLPGKLGNVAGNVAMFAPTAMIPGANTVTGAGLIGGLGSALTTPGDMGERAGAAAFGAAGGAAGQAIPQLVRSMRAAAQPLTESGRARIVGNVMNRAAGDNAPQVAARMRTAQPLLSEPTAAEVAESGGIAALQRAMSAADPEAYAHRGMQQAGARVDALRDIAGDEGKKELFRTARSSTAKDLYDRAFSVAIEPENLSPAMRGEVTKLMQMPAIQDALSVARVNAQNHGMDLKSMEGSIAGLHQAKLAMDDKIAALAGGTANQANEAAAITAARDRLTSFMEKMSPDYREARGTYAAMSRPVNQMDIGQTLMDKMKPALTDHGALAKETANSFAQALRNGDATAKAATGRNLRFNEVMEPEQIETLNRIAQELARKSNAQDLGRGVGSNTYQNFAMDNLTETMGVPSAVKAIGGIIPGMSPTATLVSRGAGAAGRAAYSRADEAMRRDMAQALLNPQAAARLMEDAAAPQGMARLLQSLPPGVQRALPPEDLLRLLQAAPGVGGMALANTSQQ